jgi:exonuclease III
MAYTICTLNVRGLVNFKKRQEVFHWLKSKKYKIILLQETHLTADNIDKWKTEWQGDIFVSSPNSNSQGVAILISPDNSNEINIINYKEVSKGRLIALELKLNEEEFTIINIYGPNNDDVSIFTVLENYLYANCEKKFIIGGDFNTILDLKMDKQNGRSDTHRKCREKIQCIIRNFALIDIWRFLNPKKQQYTWSSNNKPPIFSRLDFFLVTDTLCNVIKNCHIKQGFRTDHSIVHFQFDLQKQKRGPGYFKLNNSLILIKEYNEKIIQCIQSTVNFNKGSKPDVLWELIKGNIRNVTIKFASKKKKQDTEKETELVLSIEKIEHNIQSTINPSQDYINELNKKKTELQLMYENKIKGIILRSKAIDIEMNEKNTKYFSDLEKRHGERKTIQKLTVQGKIITDPKDILDEETSFFANLYQKQNYEIPEVNLFSSSDK